MNFKYPRILFRFILFILFSVLGVFARAQEVTETGRKDTVAPLLIEDIVIAGIKKTRPQIILRELGFAKGTFVLPGELEELLTRAQQQLVNTSLFLSVSVSKSQLSDKGVVVHIELKERWYIFPAPVFSLADKNFNFWWNQQMRSLDRINYGLALVYKNVSGRNDNLDIGFQTGYNPSWGIFYNLPNLGRKQQHEIGVLFINGRAREVNYSSMFDRKSFFRLDTFIRRHVEFKLNYTFRKNINTRHVFSAGFVHEGIADTVARLNPAYLGNGRTGITYPSFTYRFLFNNTNNHLYPLKGKLFSAELLHNGFGKRDGINITQLKVDAGIYEPLGKGFYVNGSVSGKVFLPRQQPFIMFRGLGYNDKEVFRGLDQYVLDGNAYGIVKTNLIKRLFATTVNAKFLPAAFRTIPFQVYVKGIFDGGYVSSHNPGNNSLVNRWLFTKGFGLDIVSFYDINITFEYSFNQWMERGLFFRSKFGLNN